VKKRCWLATIPDSGACDGRLVRCHLLPQQLLRRELGPRGWRRVASDPRSWVWGCGGPVGCSGHHGALDYSRTLRVPRVMLPAGLEVLAEDLGLSWWLDREYGLPS
jgi:hypothetical protein